MIECDVHALVSPVLQDRKLRPRHDIAEPGWAFWELRNLNMHRLVGVARPQQAFADADAVESYVRDTMTRHFKRSWWRGMAYGVVLDRVSVDCLDALIDIVDVIDNSKGTLQWAVLLAPGAPVAIGVHTWIEGYLSPVYRRLMDELRRLRFDVTSLIRPRDGLAGMLFEINDFRAAMASFNVRQHAFREFSEKE
jgi:hypothetical protein